jgi:hypothetical protein
MRSRWTETTAINGKRRDNSQDFDVKGGSSRRVYLVRSAAVRDNLGFFGPRPPVGED